MEGQGRGGNTRTPPYSFRQKNRRHMSIRIGSEMVAGRRERHGKRIKENSGCEEEMRIPATSEFPPGKTRLSATRILLRIELLPAGEYTEILRPKIHPHPADYGTELPQTISTRKTAIREYTHQAISIFRKIQSIVIIGVENHHKSQFPHYVARYGIYY